MKATQHGQGWSKQGIDPKSIFFFGLIVLICFGGALGAAIYSHFRLQTLHEIQDKAHRLPLAWRKCEALTLELFSTYTLNTTRKQWNQAKALFETEFQSFLDSRFTRDLIRQDLDFQIEVERARIHMNVIRDQFQTCSAELKTYLAAEKPENDSGNLLVNFGENWATGHYQEGLVDAISALRRSTSMSNTLFANELSAISRQMKNHIQEQTRSLRLNAVLLPALLIGIAGIFILYHMLELARSRRASQRHALKLAREIETRKRAEEMIQSESEKLREVLNAMGHGMYIVDGEQIVRYQNAFVTSYYETECIGRKCFKAYMGSEQPCSFCRVQATIAGKAIHQSETVLEDGNNYELIFSPFVDVDGRKMVIVLWCDITEKKRIEAEAMHNAHLASIGELAAGVAHEINNPINGIINYAERLLNIEPRCARTGEFSERIITESERIARIVSNLLSFARKDDEHHSLLSVQEVLSDALELVKRQLDKEGIELRVDIPGELPYIRAQAQELQQVFLNLFSNARYALRQKEPASGEVKRLHISAETLSENGQSRVRITIQDNGPGIPPEIMDKILTPFFSTKPRGEGTGLGLSISHGIIKRHGGTLVFESATRSYARAVILLPVEGGGSGKTKAPGREPLEPGCLQTAG